MEQYILRTSNQIGNTVPFEHRAREVYTGVTGALVTAVTNSIWNISIATHNFQTIQSPRQRVKHK